MLERFYGGETSLEEEKMLRDYFASNKVPEELIPDKDLFQSFEDGADSVEVPSDLNQKILSSIDQAERRETARLHQRHPSYSSAQYSPSNGQYSSSSPIRPCSHMRPCSSGG